MKVSPLIVIFLFVFLCLGHKNVKIFSSIQSSKRINLSNYKTSHYDENKLFEQTSNDSLGFTDTVFSCNGIKILKTNIRKIDKGYDVGIYTIRRITILNKEQKIYENDSIIDFDKVEYNPKLKLLTVPLIFDEDGESFSTIGKLVLYDSSSNKIKEIDNDLVNVTNAPITDDSLIYYIANSSLYCYGKGKVQEIAHFNNTNLRAFKVDYLSFASRLSRI